MSDRRDLYAELLPLLDSPSRDPVRERGTNGGRAWSFCPCHTDGTKYGKRSLSLHPAYGLDCFAGCAFRDIVRALRARNGGHPAHAAPTATYSRNGNGNKPSRIGGPVVATWTYEDESGRPRFRVLRKEWPDGTKTFLQQHPDGNGGWAWGRGGARYVLYRLPQLLASDRAELVFIVEGERCADALVDLGLIATTSPEGAGKWRPEYAASLRGRPVVILPDNDPPGAAHAEAVSGSLAGIASKVLILTLPGLPEKGDVINWLANGGSREALLKPVSEALQ